MASNRFRERMNSGAPLTGTHIMTAHEDLFEIAAATGLYDTIEFSAEYSMFDMRLLNNMARAAELYDTSLIIKLDQYSQGFWAQAAIGAGFHAVLFTDIRTPDDIVACHKILRPDKPGIDGHMGVKIRRIAIEGYGSNESYLQKIEDIGFMIMIEKDVAVQNLDEICSVAAEYGVDMIQWGPSDFGFSRPSTPTPEEIQNFEKQVIKTALANGIRPRVELEFPTPEKMEYYTALGIKDYCAMWDRSALSSGWTKTGTALKEELAARWSQYYEVPTESEATVSDTHQLPTATEHEWRVRAHADKFEKIVAKIKEDPAIIPSRRLAETFRSVGLTDNQNNRYKLKRILAMEGLS